MGKLTIATLLFLTLSGLPASAQETTTIEGAMTSTGALLRRDVRPLSTMGRVGGLKFSSITVSKTDGTDRISGLQAEVLGCCPIFTTTVFVDADEVRPLLESVQQIESLVLSKSKGIVSHQTRGGLIVGTDQYGKFHVSAIVAEPQRSQLILRGVSLADLEGRQFLNAKGIQRLKDTLVEAAELLP